MKKRILFAVLFLAINFSLSAQGFNKQYSVKATSWLENKFNLPSSPYQITIKTLGEKSNKRLSAGLNIGTNYSETVASALSVSVRFGKERFIDFGKKQNWRLFYGLDYLANGRLNLSNGNNNGSLSLGVAPLAGLQYRINERLILYTETSYELGITGLLSNRRDFIARLSNRLVPIGSIWLGFELFRPKKN